MMKTREEIIIPLIKDKKILDLGNSWGDFKELIRSNCLNYSGLDVESGADFQEDLNKSFDLKESFDVIIAGELIEHIANTEVFLNNVKRHLKEGGLFFLTTPNPTSFRFFFYALFNKEPEYGGHIKYFTKDSLVLLLEDFFNLKKIGFTCNVTNNKNRGKLSWLIKFHVEKLIGNVVPRLSPNIYCVCELK